VEHGGIDPAVAGAAELSPRDPDDWDTAFFRRWIERVEPHLTAPTFVTEWPASQAALATVRTDGPWPVAERFEAFLGGVELANAFQELGDARELRRRWRASSAARVAHGEPPHPIDEAFLAAVDRLPRAAGIALGVERLVAALLGWDGIARGWAG
jgi:lysyl-tRNA synthetase class 2